ncbi:CHAP domain-containing protein [Actinomadura pelletieri DSM 43383]|uniref:CHAP domain-containing protein n=1 Tax=Actinomadura pelletieri DSM 43383 TaxID=1120940 RepID=A0A495QKL0_9ACTN|nr:CHAP domain-containing protein [Actinomadura pelletieri]RKS73023.1 CHAP domain-containing protein [Actinomadura pelletieri DSM 43383]
MDPIGKKLLDIAKKELGYTEKSDGYTKFGEWYRKNIDGDHDEYFSTAPWCDMFLAWAADKADVTEQTGQFAATVDHAKWFKKNDAWGKEPEPGAIVFYDWNGSDDIDQIDHVGIVEKVDGKTLHTIEGNADGYKLMRKTRDMDSVVGFGYPSKVKVAAKYTPKHAAPAPTVDKVGAPATNSPTTTHEQQPPSVAPEGLPTQEVVLGGILAFVLCGTVALAAGRVAAAKAPAASPIRVRKRGKHHRPAVPVTLPADLTPADLDSADAGTTVMPALSLAAAHEAEDREFWGRIAHLEEDSELTFWNSLHAELSESQYASTHGFR